MGLTSTFVQINAIIGLVLPIIIAVVQQGQWSKQARVVVEVVIAVIASVVSALAQHKLNLHDWGAAIIMIFVMTKAAYLSWNKVGATDAVEYATTGARGRRAITHKKKLRAAAGG